MRVEIAMNAIASNQDGVLDMAGPQEARVDSVGEQGWACIRFGFARRCQANSRSAGHCSAI